MRLEVIRSRQEFRHIKPAWDELHTRSRTTHPFASSCWIDSWMQNMLQNTKFQQHDWHILTCWQGAQLVAGVPLFVTNYGLGQTGILRYLRPIGSDQNITEIRAPLLDPEYAHVSVILLKKQLKHLSQNYDLMRWPDLPLAPSEDQQYDAEHCVEEYILPLARTWDEFRGGLKRNIKESIRKCYNAPAREGLNLEFKADHGHLAIKQSMADFYRLHHLRSAAALQPKHRDYFANAAARRFIEAFIQDSHGIEPLLFSVWHGQQMVAARLGFVVNRALYLYFSGYDPSYARYSVMTRVVSESIQHAIAHGLDSVNLSPGTDPSKLRWHPQRQAYLSHAQQANSLRGRCMQHIHAWTAALRRPHINKSADVVNTALTPARS